MNEQQRHRCAELMLDRLHERFSDRAVARCLLATAARYRNGAEGLMLNRFQGWRERGWSVAMPRPMPRPGSVLAAVSPPIRWWSNGWRTWPIPVRYLAWEQVAKSSGDPDLGP
jgi:hypothetical protein